MKSLQSTVNLEKLMKQYHEGDWRKVLALLAEGSEDEMNERNSFSTWVKPTEESLRFLSSEAGDTQMVSVGCGSGLLEWLVEAATGVRVIGLEMDRAWWETPHGPPTFIPLYFFEETTLTDLCGDRPITLLFCYFNNAIGFNDYVRNFHGRKIIIIGPGEGRGTHASPSPFVNSLPLEWNLKTLQEVGTTKDYIAVYTR